MYIGEIYLPILSSIDKKSVSKITKEIAGINITDPKSVSIRRNLQPVTLDGYLYNDGEKNDAQYAEDVEALQYRSAGYCYTKYADLDGFIEIDNADAPQTSEELGVRNYSIEGKYLPATKYERVVEVETEMRENEFNIEFPPHVALPIGATNVRVKTSQDSVKLSAPTFMAGNIPIYRPFPAFYPADVTHSDSDAPQYDATAYKLSYNLLDAENENISYTMVSGIDVPLGSYRVVLRIKADSTVNGDVKITVSDGTNNVVDSLHTLVGDGVWNIVKTASFSILQRGLTYTVTVSKATDSVSNIAVNYGFLLPEKRARVAFDVAAEYDVGECKVYDTITTDAAEAGWIQVYNPEHDFAGDIVVQNSMFRWVIKQTAWKDATKVYNVTGTSPVEIGELYNKAFGDDSVAIKFKEIKPNYLKFTFELDTGNVTSESTSAKEIDTVEITPFNVVIDKDVIGTYKDHYTFESTPGAMVEYENGIIAGIDSNSVYGLIKSVDVTSSVDGDIIETTGSESSDSYVVPFIIPCEITSYLYKQAADLVISKDNNDIERKFWKDDFSVDSSDNYTGDVADFTWDTANSRTTSASSTPKTLTKLLTVQHHRFRWVTQFENSVSGIVAARYFRFGKVSQAASFKIYQHDGSNVILYYNLVVGTYNSGNFGLSVPDAAVWSNTIHAFEVIINTPTSISVYIDGALLKTFTLSVSMEMDSSSIAFSCSNPNSVDCHLYELTALPSESYSDNFTSDTVSGVNGRYQAVTGTVAYDDVNKRMNVITTTGANGKASGRLKSYKFTEGSQIYDVTLPTGADGDFITLVTHSANGLMTDGIGVGLQSDGAGNWNLATLSGTTVTEGADSGLDDADVARIEIEKDVTGTYWYYIYDAAGTKPTTATGKLFTTLTEGYTGWYANGAGAETQTYAIDNISIRAESIVGRTNVQVEEPFWFRDEFSENSLGRYAQSGSSGSWTYNSDDGRLRLTTIDNAGKNLIVAGLIKNASVSVDLYPVLSTNNSNGGILLTTSLPGSKYSLMDGSYARVEFGPGDLIKLQFCPDIKNLNTKITSITRTWMYGEKFTLTLSDNGVEVRAKVYDSAGNLLAEDFSNTIIPNCNYVSLTGYPISATESRIMDYDNLQISGTRVYNKPIHRGAMLETYFDGTQEVVGTTFVDDCQWDRSGEWTGDIASFTRNTTNGRITIAATQKQITSNAGKFGEGIYSFDYHPEAATTVTGFIIGSQSQDSGSMIGGNKYIVYLNNASGIYVYKYVGGVQTNLLNTTYTFTNGTTYRFVVTWFAGVFKIYINDILTTTAPIDTTFNEGYFGFGTNSTGQISISNIAVIAASPDATNGIAACIPPIGGGARYGVEESVYNTFTTANVDKGSYLAATKTKTTNIAADESSLEFINETDSTTLSLERTETEKSLTLNADYTVLTESLNIDDEETDTLTVGVKNSTTCNQPTTYVESLSLIPVSGNNVLYPQDLAFISGVKSSQKRKVEVK